MVPQLSKDEGDERLGPQERQCAALPAHPGTLAQWSPRVENWASLSSSDHQPTRAEHLPGAFTVASSWVPRLTPWQDAGPDRNSVTGAGMEIPESPEEPNSGQGTPPDPPLALRPAPPPQSLPDAPADPRPSRPANPSPTPGLLSSPACSGSGAGVPAERAGLSGGPAVIPVEGGAGVSETDGADTQTGACHSKPATRTLPQNALLLAVPAPLPPSPPPGAHPPALGSSTYSWASSLQPAPAHLARSALGKPILETRPPSPPPHPGRAPAAPPASSAPPVFSSPSREVSELSVCRLGRESAPEPRREQAQRGRRPGARVLGDTRPSRQLLECLEDEAPSPQRIHGFQGFSLTNFRGFSVGQPATAPQSESGEGSCGAQEQMSPAREERGLGMCSGHEAPRLKQGAHTDQGEPPCGGGWAGTPPKAESQGSCPGDDWIVRKVKVEDEDQEAEAEVEWPQHLSFLPSSLPAPDLGPLPATYKLEPGPPGRLALSECAPAREKPFGCGECERRFRDWVTLRLHQRLHRGEGPRACPDCGRSFAQRAHLLLHQRSHRGERPFPCAECGKRFSKKAHLTRHLRTHTGERPYPCAECGKRFSQKIHLGSHQKTHTGERPFPCAECDKRFRKKTHLIRHQRIHTGERPYPCARCSRSFTHRQHLARHERVHEAQSPALPAPRPLAGSDCVLSFGCKSLAVHQCLPRGEGTPADPAANPAPLACERPFSCPDCGRGFAHGQHLARHRRVHTGERPFACGQCGRRFGSRPNLAAHARAHSGARPFACAQCGHRFSRKSHLVRHQAVHTGSRPHSCPVCARSFSSKTNLVRHQAIHTGSRPFSCAQCGKSFSRKTHLVRHQRIHSVEATHAASDAAPAWPTANEGAPPRLFF
ncbi:zinc finger protein 467 [Dugong dugon]